MKAIITADWHFGYPDRLKDLEWAFNTIIDYALKENIEYVFLLGDLIDDRRYVTHDVNNKVVELLCKAKVAGISVVSFPGNHDMFMRFNWRNNAIGPYAEHLTLIDYIGNFTLDGRKFWVIPFIEHEDIYQKVLMEVNKLASENDVLLTHIGVSEAVMNVSFLLQNWSVVSFEGTKFSKVFTGHFHCHQKVGEKTWYPGSPLAFRHDEGVVEHGFIVYDIKSGSHEFINIYDVGPKIDVPPEFLTIDKDDVGESFIAGNNIKVMLGEGDHEDDIRAKLVAAGAKNVSFTKLKDKEVDFSVVGSINSDGMFDDWLAFDKPPSGPDGFDYDLLRTLNKEIEAATPVEVEDD